MCGRPVGVLMPCLGPGGPGPREPPHGSGEAPPPFRLARADSRRPAAASRLRDVVAPSPAFLSLSVLLERSAVEVGTRRLQVLVLPPRSDPHLPWGTENMPTGGAVGSVRLFALEYKKRLHRYRFLTGD